jgi:hypothetical protein
MNVLIRWTIGYSQTYTFRHCDDNVEKAVSRVLDIWEERGIYDDHAIGQLRPRSYTPPYSPPPEITAKPEEEAADPLPAEEDAEVPVEPPDTEIFLEQLKTLEHSAPSHDDRTRQQVANIPQELLDASYISSIEGMGIKSVDCMLDSTLQLSDVMFIFPCV